MLGLGLGFRVKVQGLSSGLGFSVLGGNEGLRLGLGFRFRVQG